MTDIVEFIKESHMFFLATVDGDAPKLRPFGGLNEVEGKYYFSTNSKKEVFLQMMKNPKVSICAFNKGSWLRIEGEVERETDAAVIKQILEMDPFLKKIQQDEGNMFECLYLKHATVKLYRGHQEPEVWNL